MNTIIELIKIGNIDESILVKLKKNLERTFSIFSLSVNIIHEAILLEEREYDPNRRQYNVLKILKKMIILTQNKQFFRTLGIMDEDIYFNDLSFVFGRAINPKNRKPGFPIVALISITRLRENFYRRPENKANFELRILKEAIHELGHTFSLEHCDDYCIMRFSNALIDTDKKPPQFCDSCLKKLTIFFKSL